MTPIAILNLFCCLVNSAQADNPLDHFDWRSRLKENNDTAAWMVYVNVLIYKCSFNQLFVVQQLKLKTLNIEYAVEAIQNDKLAEVITGRYKKLLEPSGLYHQIDYIVKYLHFSLYLQSAEKLQIPNLIRRSMRVAVWHFNLDKKLRVRIRVEKLVIYSTFHTDRCRFNAKILSNDDSGSSERFVLCGIYSNFLYFSHGHRIQFTLSYSLFHPGWIQTSSCSKNQTIQAVWQTTNCFISSAGAFWLVWYRDHPTYAHEGCSVTFSVPGWWSTRVPIWWCHLLWFPHPNTVLEVQSNIKAHNIPQSDHFNVWSLCVKSSHVTKGILCE